MQSKKSRYRTRPRSTGTPSRTAVRYFLLLSLTITVVVIAAGVLATRLAQHRRRGHIDKAPISSGSTFEVTSSSGDTAWDPAWPAFPQTGQPARPIEVVRAAYAYAVRREDVLRYMPCYCGCERQGHHSNRDCFVRGKTAAGTPAWDRMGYT